MNAQISCGKSKMGVWELYELLKVAQLKKKKKNSHFITD